MAISVAWQTVVTVTTTVNTAYTVPSASTAPYGSYGRDLVICNGGAATIMAALVPSGSATATTTGSFAIPAGGSVILTQCQVPAGAIVGLVSPTAATAQTYIGFATNVAFT